MAAKYIVVANGPLSAQQEITTELIKNSGAGWWHWYPHVWLIHDGVGRGIGWWRDYLLPAIGVDFLIFDAANTGWSGRSDEKHFEWMYENWFPYRNQ